MAAFGEFLKKCINLESINLQHNIIGSEGGMRIFEALIELKVYDKLVYINLEGCEITTKGLMKYSFEEKLY